MRKKRSRRGRGGEKRHIRERDVKRIGAIESEQYGDERAAPDIPREKEKDGEQDENDEEIARRVPRRERRIRRERIHLGDCVGGCGGGHAIIIPS